MRQFMKRRTGQIIRIPIKRQIKYLLMLFLVAWAGCKGPKSASEGEAPSGDKTLTLLMSDLYGGAEQEELHVIRNAKELKAYFATINRTRKPGLPVPVIDFDHEVALLYFPGKMQNTALPELFLTGEKEGKLCLGVKTAATAKEEKTASAVVIPFLLYKLPAGQNEILLERRP